MIFLSFLLRLGGVEVLAGSNPALEMGRRAKNLIQKYLTVMPNTTTVTDQIVGASLPDLVLGLGLAVADANEKLSTGKSGVVYTIPEAEIELSVAFSIKETKEIGLSAGGNIYAFNVNASYASTFGFTGEASSKIKVKLRADMREKPQT